MHDHSSKSRKIGQILIHEGLIDTTQLEQALRIQAQSTSYKPLGKILEESGAISRLKLKDILLKYKKQIPLGELLVKMGLISHEQLAEALTAQEHSHKKIGRLLVEKGFINRQKLIDAICLQLGIDGADLKTCHVDRGLLEKVSVGFLRKRKIIPLKHDTRKNVLTVLMEDPTDTDASVDLEKVFGVTVRPVMLRDGGIDYLLDGIFDIWHLSDWTRGRHPRAFA